MVCQILSYNQLCEGQVSRFVAESLHLLFLEAYRSGWGVKAISKAMLRTSRKHQSDFLTSVRKLAIALRRSRVPALYTDLLEVGVVCDSGRAPARSVSEARPSASVSPDGVLQEFRRHRAMKNVLTRIRQSVASAEAEATGSRELFHFTRLAWRMLTGSRD